MYIYALFHISSIDTPADAEQGPQKNDHVLPMFRRLNTLILTGRMADKTWNTLIAFH
jgi:hypothetical protein